MITMLALYGFAEIALIKIGRPFNAYRVDGMSDFGRKADSDRMPDLC